VSNSAEIDDDLLRLAERITTAAATDLSDDEAQLELESISAELRVLIARRFGARRRAAHGEGARAMILAHLKTKLGEWVEGQELAAISGIQEWARRVRELRVQDGYDVEEDAGRYRLVNENPDAAAAQKWRIANEIRRRPGSARDRILEYLIAEVGHVVTRDQLDYVAKIKEGSRRVRELRDELGWPIESHIDVSFLQPGQYRLVSADRDDRRDIRQRLYPEGLRAQVFERDDFTCQQCRRDREHAAASGDRRFYLEVHHRSAVADQLDGLPTDQLNDPTNLVTYCHSCHLRETAEFQRKRRLERGYANDAD
jgi:biotin operon repressor